MLQHTRNQPHFLHEAAAAREGRHEGLLALRALLVCAAGVAGAVSRTATAPVDRMKLLLQVDSTVRGLTVREGWNRMAAEGGPAPQT